MNEFARKNNFTEVEISSRKKQNERKINKVFSTLQEDDVLIITELSSLGRSLSGIFRQKSFYAINFQDFRSHLPYSIFFY
ncbi:recombinase family protein [Rickettsiales endosymbiont of Trichoplax sp. H2]|uniref:recombinase family protein n=1 Tax=Rickettsiales endosymbiont of Trichoplax sp. H2 TaxID=2021221 RepID=UPI0034DCD05F